jgi:ssDNA-binding Zn-finger/Zn-ribbon topoisomerase 1
VATTKGRDTIALLGTHALTSAELTGSWEKRLSEIEHGQADRAGFMADIARFTEQLVDYFRDIRTESLGACPNGDGDVIENRSAFGCSSYQSKKEPGCGFTIWKTQAGFTIDRDQVRALLEKGEVELQGPVEARLVLADGNTPAIVDEQGTPVAQAQMLGPCPNGDGEIKENRAAFGCTSYKSKKEPGCGFTVWKTQAGFTITADDVRALLEGGEATLEGPRPAKLVLIDGNTPQIVGEDGAPLTGAIGAKVVRETIATCPRCGGEIRGNSRAYGCSYWKSRKNPGCGFVIWKSMKGREITPEQAKQVIEQGSTGPLEFRDRQGAFTGRLVMTDDKSVEVVRADSAEAAA